MKTKDETNVYIPAVFLMLLMRRVPRDDRSYCNILYQVVACAGLSNQAWNQVTQLLLEYGWQRRLRFLFDFEHLIETINEAIEVLQLSDGSEQWAELTPIKQWDPQLMLSELVKHLPEMCDYLVIKSYVHSCVEALFPTMQPTQVTRITSKIVYKGLTQAELSAVLHVDDLYTRICYEVRKSSSFYTRVRESFTHIFRGSRK